jgi:hypothetical protein
VTKPTEPTPPPQPKAFDEEEDRTTVSGPPSLADEEEDDRTTVSGPPADMPAPR